jgi:hypothetical protein
MMQTLRRTVAVLTGAALAGWILDRAWDRAFLAVETEPVTRNDDEGHPRQGRRVRVQSIFAAPPEAVWDKVTTPALLAFVAHPLLSFKQQNGTPLPEVWREGASLHLHLFALGCMPLGPHTIHAERIDAERREIHSRESGRIAKVWRHFIAVTGYPGGRTLYTDEIDIYAGALTTAVAAFARLFYRYRQTRWHTVIRRLETEMSNT